MNLTTKLTLEGDYLARGNLHDIPGRRRAESPMPLTEGSEPVTDQGKNADTKEPSNLYSPRPDRQGHKVTADNAQAHLKPECCIFVANLPSARPDALIGSALNDVFSRFGKCFVKLKRDRGMPIAFVQYDNSADASQALDQGAGLIILGRKCRTERAKAPSKSSTPLPVSLLMCTGCVYVSRRDGAMPSEGEVVGLLASRGEVEKTWAPTETEQELHKLPPGFFVRFAYYQDAVDAMNVSQMSNFSMSNLAPQESSADAPRPCVMSPSITLKPNRLQDRRRSSIQPRCLRGPIQRQGRLCSILRSTTTAPSGLATFRKQSPRQTSRASLEVSGARSGILSSESAATRPTRLASRALPLYTTLTPVVHTWLPA